MPLPWTNDKQHGLLSSLSPLFRQHQADGTVAFFWPVMLEKWEEEYPDSTYDDGKSWLKRLQAWFYNHGQDTDGENALITTAPKPGRQGMVKFGQRVRKLSYLQMYQRVYYDTKWAKICEAKWQEYLAQPVKDDGRRKARITFVNELCTKFLGDETAEVKKEIEMLMERQSKGEQFLSEPAVEEGGEVADETAANERVKAIQETLTMWNENIQMLPKTVVGLLKEIQHKTGFAVTLLVGGPHPGDDGKMVSLCVDSEAGKENLTFKKAYPKYATIENEFLKYLHVAFPDEVRNRRSLARLRGSHSMDADLDVNMEPEKAVSQGAKPDEPAKLKIGPPKGKKPSLEPQSTKESTSAGGGVAAPSTEPRELSSFGYKFGDIIPYKVVHHPNFIYPIRPVPGAEFSDSDDATEESSDKLATSPKTGATRPASHDIANDTALLNQQAAIATGNPADDEPLKATEFGNPSIPASDPAFEPAQPESSTPHAGSASQSESKGDGTTTAPPANVIDPGNGSLPLDMMGTSGVQQTNGTDSAAPPTTTGSLLADIDTQSSRDTQTVSASSDIGVQLPPLPSTPSPPTPLQPAPRHDIPSASIPSDPLSPRPTTARPTSPAPTPSTGANTKASIPTVTPAASPTETSLLPVRGGSPEHDSHGGLHGANDSRTRTNPFLTDPNLAEAPYVTATVRFLENVAAQREKERPDLKLEELRDEFEYMVNVWAGVDRRMGYPAASAKGHKLGTKDRPQEVMWWLGRGRDYSKIPPIEDVAVYGSAVRVWWIGLQPAWRREDAKEEWPLSRHVSPYENWEALARGGANGLTVLMVALGWWMKMIDDESSAAELVSMVEDVRWVLDEIKKGIDDGPVVEMLLERGGAPKRGLEGDDGEKGRAQKKRRASRR